MKHLKIPMTLFFMIGFTLMNCDDDCSCPKNEGSYFEIQGIESLMHFEQITRDALSPIPEGGKIPFNDYNGFALKYSVSYISMNQEKKSHTSGMGQLYACDCLEYSGMNGAKHERVEDIKVITLNDFNERYKANDTINEIVSLRGLPLNEYLSQDTELINHSIMSFKLDEAPSMDEGFKVKIILKLNTGEIYEKESSTVRFE